MASSKKTGGPRILTANTLLTGRKVYWTANGWDASPQEAIQASNETEISELQARGQTEEMVNMIVGAYLVPLGQNAPNQGQRIAPVELRERQRMGGPSIGLPGAVQA